MFMYSLQNALTFCIHTIISTYIIIVLFRFMLQLVRGNFHNPLAQFAVKATNPLLVPLRKVIPGYAKIDFASIVLALILQVTELYVVLLINGFNIAPNATAVAGLWLWGIGELLDLTLVFFFFTTLLQVIGSWLSAGNYNYALMLLSSITAPLLNPIRRILPDLGVLDFSPLIFMFIIYVLRIAVAAPIIYYGKGLI